MRHIAKELENIRARGRWLLVWHRLLQWAAAVLMLFVFLGIVDYLLRLPGWFRFLVDLVVVIGAVGWVVSRATGAFQFNPDLATLALRAERFFPQLSGVLASGVEFARQRQGADESPRTLALEQAAVQNAESQLDGVKLGQMINPTQTLRSAGWFSFALLLVVIVATSAPVHTSLALRRWMMPFGHTAWPRRVDVQTLVTDAVWPSDTPVRLTAVIDRGFHRNMRTWVNWRIVSEDGIAGSWSSLLMNEQSQSRRFERLIDVPAALTNLTDGIGTLEFWFEAGDDVTDTQQIQLIQRPALEQVTARITPPRYAQGLVDQQVVELTRSQATAGQIATVSALQGSTVELSLGFNKPIPVANAQLAKLLSGAPTLEGASANYHNKAGFTRQVDIQFELTSTLQTPIQLRDEHNLTDLSERLYRIEAVIDKPPAVSLSEPPADEAVLPTAIIDVVSVAQDDIGVESLSIDATLKEETKTVHQQSGRSSRLSATHKMALADWEVKPGDEVVLIGRARDVYELNGMRHDPQKSTPRRLRIIDTPTLISQLRNDLAGVRQQAIRLQTTQQQIINQPAQEAHPKQQQITARIDTQLDLVDRVVRRMQRNQLKEPQLDQLLDRSNELLKQAQTKSQAAASDLENAMKQPDQAPIHKQQSKQSQQQVEKALVDLIALLDQGRDALTLQLQLQQIKTTQEDIAKQSRELLPKTLGKTAGELTPQELQELKNLVDKQQALSEQTQQLTQQMRQTSEAMSRQSKDPQDQAMAQSLSEAASVAQRKGLTQSMKKAAASTSQNRLSEAGGEQQKSLETLEEMLDKLEDQQQRQQEILRRRLMQLVEAIERLVERQTHELERLDLAERLAGLEEPLVTLRNNTLDIAQSALEPKQTVPVAELLNEAAKYQAEAITGLRKQQRDAAVAGETEALSHLKQALEKAVALRNAAKTEENRQQRDKLKKQYLALAEQELALAEKTKPYLAIPKINRRQVLELIKLGKEQTTIHEEIRKLGQVPDVSSTLMFDHLHKRVDDHLTRTVRDLNTAKIDSRTVQRQVTSARLLKEMAAALEQDDAWDEFAENNASGGGGGGGSGGQQPLVPPAAELRLLRGLQESILDRTRSAHQSADQTDKAVAKRLLLDISVEQRELSGLGERLIEKMSQQSGPQVPNIEVPGPPESTPDSAPDTTPAPEGETDS